MKGVWNASPKRYLINTKERERNTYPKINFKGGHNMGCLGPTLTSMWYSLWVQLSFKKESPTWLNVETYEVTLRIRRDDVGYVSCLDTNIEDYIELWHFSQIIIDVCVCVWCLVSVSKYVFHTFKPVL
jgi:hypothetical protein